MIYIVCMICVKEVDSRFCMKIKEWYVLVYKMYVVYSGYYVN